MKYSVLFLALLSTNVLAGGKPNPLTGDSYNHVSGVTSTANGNRQEQSAISDSVSNSASTSRSASDSASNSSSNARTGASSSETQVSIENDAARIPVSTASGSFSNTTSPCRYLQANSVQFLFFGGSNTSMNLDLVCALEKPLNEEQKLALCLSNADYRKVRAQLGAPCEIK